MQKDATKSRSKKTLASRGAGLAGVNENVVNEVATKGTDLVLWLVKTTIIVGGIYWAYKKYTNRFGPKKTVSNWAASNISDSEATTRANAIYNAGSFFGVGDEQFNITAQNLSGNLNYNALVKIYNAFGHKTSYLFSGDMDLVQWLQDQMTDYHFQELVTLTNGALTRL